MTTNRISIKGVKFSEFASEETHCFEATVCLDGKPYFKTGNEGHGGPDSHWGLKREAGLVVREKVAEVNAICAEYPRSADFPDIVPDCEWVVGELLTRWLVRRDMQRLMRSKVLGVVDGQLLEWGTGKGRGPFSKLPKPAREDMVERIKAYKPGVQICNEMDLEEVVEIALKLGA